MLTDIQSKQRLIKEKNYKELAGNSDFVWDFNWDNQNWKFYTMDEDLLNGFFLDSELVSENLENSRKVLNKKEEFFFFSMWSGVFELIRTSGTVPSQSTWQKIARHISDLARAKRNDRISYFACLQLTDKGPDFVKAVVLDTPTYDYMIKDIPLNIGITNTVTSSLLEGLSKEELDVFKSRMTYGGIAKLDVQDNKAFTMLYPDLYSVIEVFLSARTRSPILAALCRISPDKEYIDSVLKFIRTYPYLTDYYATSLDVLEAYKHHPKLDVPDEVLEYVERGAKINLTYSSAFRDLIKNMSTEQIKKYSEYYEPSVAASNKNFPLGDLKNLYPDKRIIDLVTSRPRFFKEEEIIANPEFFRPESLSSNPIYYVSKETMKLLRRVHGGRARYNDGLADFHTLFRKGFLGLPLTLENVKYIKEKTGTSNKEMIDIISGFKDIQESSKKPLTDDQLRIYNLQKLVKSFKE